MMNERLKLAKRLLSDTGVIFISIDDSEQAYLKVLCDEIFGEENFVANLVWQKKKGGSQDSENFSREHEYIICFQKKDWHINEVIEEQDENAFSKVINGRKAKLLKLEKWGNHSLRSDRPTLYYAIKDPYGMNFYPIAPNGADGCWRKKPENLDNAHIYWKKNSKGRLTPYEVIYFDEIKNTGKVVKTRTILTEYGTTTDATKEILKIFNNQKIFDTPKPISLIKKLLSTAIKDIPTAIVLDFFAGSGTTGQAVMELNEEDGGQRKFILVTNNENGIGENIIRERLYRVINGKGSKGEKINWTYTKDKPCLAGNSVRVFNIETDELTLNDLDKAEELKEKARLEFKKLNENYKTDNDFDIYNELSALNPQKKDKK